ncbi:helix-turn-helix transcriptional regulator [Pengzhenrongella sp.]|jgi:predicted ArsR family transcriptional regulator|uniref:helix-turn-helix transcriptional regulator n=1 Tax=Pengzhenrongella sp. TaxID=2888820 RepID=UPI002F934DAA
MSPVLHSAVGHAPPLPAELPSEAEATTRQRVLQLVASAGPVTAAELATELHLTPAGIRRHLGVLETDRQIGLHDGVGVGPARRGRPAKHYIVTSHGQAALSNSYSELAAQALHYLADVAGTAAVDAFAAARGRVLEERYASTVADAGDDVPARASALARVLATDGYAASSRPVPGMATIQLCQGHCPVQQIAAEFPQLCEAETQAFSRLLGVHVQRLSTLASGGHVCTTNIPTTGTTLAGRTT